ncbi:MAG: hypothetical protein AAGJ79_10000, partial [Verrucomicrobiota bacterium]
MAVSPLTSMTRNADISAALGGAILVHLSLIAAGVFYLMLVAVTVMPRPRLEVSPPKSRELDVVFPNTILVEEKKEVLRLADAGGESLEEAPEDAPFEAMANTRAGSELSPVEDGSKHMPTVDGKDIPSFQLSDESFSSGARKRGATIPVIFELLESPGSAGLADQVLPGKTGASTPDKSEEDSRKPAPPGSALAGVEAFLEEIASDPASDEAADVPGQESGFQKITDLMSDADLAEFERERKEMEEKAEAMMGSMEAGEPAADGDANDALPAQVSNIAKQLDGTAPRMDRASVDAAESALGRYAREIK